jgi:hypothetical protein
MLPAWAAELLCTGGASGFIPSRITHVGYIHTAITPPTSIQPLVRVTTTVKDSHVVDDAFFHTVHNISANLNERKNKELGLWPYSSVSSDILGDFFSKKNNGQG